MRSRMFTNRVALCGAALVAGWVSGATGWTLHMPALWLGGALVAAAATVAGFIWFGRSLEAAHNERNPR